MSEPSFASLEPTLLARKGGARPAMRPQLTPLPEAEELGALGDQHLEDLGWNDMGDAGQDHDNDDTHGDAREVSEGSSNIVTLTRPNAVRHIDTGAASPTGDRKPAGNSPSPSVIPASVAMPLQPGEDEEQALVQRKPARKKRVAATGERPARRAAFTLRLDPERHLKLRLAATIRDISAQAVATEALDTLFAEIDGLDAIAARIRPN